MWKEIDASLDPWETTPGGDREEIWNAEQDRDTKEETILDVLKNWSDHTDAPMIAEELIEAQSPRAQGFNYGIGWGNTPKPEIYFDGVRISNTLDRIAHEATAKAWSMTTTLRVVRLAETVTEKANALHDLYELVRKFEGDKELSLMVKVDELANTISAFKQGT